MRIAYALLVPLVIPASIAGAQTEMLATPARARVEFKTQRIPVKIPDKGFGFVQFDIEGEVGGRASGRFTLALRGGDAAATMTEYLIMAGTLNGNESEYEFLLQGAAKSPSGSRPFSSRLKLAKAARASPRLPGQLEYEDSWSTQAMANGDVWVIDGLTCNWDGKDLICT